MKDTTKAKSLSKSSKKIEYKQPFFNLAPLIPTRQKSDSSISEDKQGEIHTSWKPQSDDSGVAN